MKIHLNLSDRGWILETLANKIIEIWPSATVDTGPNHFADVQYFITYNTFTRTDSKVNIGYFAHREIEQSASERFFKVGKAVDYCICHADLYAQELRHAGAADVRVIEPGVNLTEFKPQVRVGVVGRTYKSGRKGEAVVEKLLDTPGIVWKFTGEGWPLPGENLQPGKVSDFYNSIDYLLVPSFYEGGPMSVVEALACGKEVIAPSIGWVDNFPHIDYEPGNVDQLRNILTSLVEKRARIRESVLSYGWNRWQDGHTKLFDIIRRKHFESQHSPKTTNRDRHDLVSEIKVVIHGTEVGKDKGGPSTRAPQLVNALQARDIPANLSVPFTNIQPKIGQVSHILNVWHPDSFVAAVDEAKKRNDTLVISPVYLDLTEKNFFDVVYPNVLRSNLTEQRKLHALDSACDQIRSRRQQPYVRRAADLLAGPLGRSVDALASADRLIFLSEKERALLSQLGVDQNKGSIIHNPVHFHLFADANPDLFRERFNIGDYVLCVGRIEARKNQSLLALACKMLGVNLVLAGHVGNKSYAKLVQECGGEYVKFVGRLDTNSELLASAYKGASLFCLPSWAEGAPLAALEAAAAGAPLLLSDRAGEPEYFGEYATYCDPADFQSLCAGIERAGKQDHQSEAQQQYIAERYNWAQHTRKTVETYEAAVVTFRSDTSQVPHQRVAGPRQFIDVTSAAHKSGPPSGISRVEETYARRLRERFPDTTKLVLWNSDRQMFVPVSDDAFATGEYKSWCSKAAPAHLFPESIRPEGYLDISQSDRLVVLGGAWIRNPRFVRSLAALKARKRCAVVGLVHDVIQWKFAHLFEAGVGDEFAGNCDVFCRVLDLVLANSRRTEADILEFAAARQIALSPVRRVRFGDDLGSVKDSGVGSPDGLDVKQVEALVGSRPYVMYVSAIDARKNHRLAFDLWERLSDEFGDAVPLLVCVGSPGWGSTAIIDQVKRDPKRSVYTRLAHNINDAALTYLYQNCLFTIYPSLYEGWGMPVGESIMYGKICVASAAGSIPEVAAGYPILIDPLDFIAWYKEIRNLISSSAYREQLECRLRGYAPHTWDVSADELVSVLNSAPQKAFLATNSRVGELLKAGGADSNRETANPGVFVGGWHEAETNGVWSSGGRSQLTFVFSGLPTEARYLQIEMRAFLHEGADKQLVRVFANGEHAVDLLVPGRFTQFSIRLPETLPAESKRCRLDVEFECGFAASPSVVSGSNDSRVLGIFVTTVGVFETPELAVGGWSEIDLVGERKASAVPVRVQEDRKGLTVAMHCRLPPQKNLVTALRVESARDIKIGISDPSGKTQIARLQRGSNVVRFHLDPSIVASGDLGLEFFGKISAKDLRLALGVFDSEAMPDEHRTLGIGDILEFKSEEDDLRRPSSGSPRSWFTALGAGWSHVERAGVWSTSRLATIAFRLPSFQGSRVAVRLRCRGFVPRGSRPTRMNISAGRRSVNSVELGSESSEHLAFLPVDDKQRVAFSVNVNELRQPSEFGGADTRPLGVLLEAIEVLGSLDSVNYHSGFGAKEAEGRWTLDETAVVFAPVPENGFEAVKVKWRALVGQEKHNTAEVALSIDGRRDVELAFDNPKARTDLVSFPEGRRLRGGIIALEITRKGELISPGDIGPSEDLRKLGVFIYSIDLV